LDVAAAALVVPCRETTGLTVNPTFSPAQRLASPRLVARLKLKSSVAEAGGETNCRPTTTVSARVAVLLSEPQVAVSVYDPVEPTCSPEKLNGELAGVCVVVPALNEPELSDSVTLPQLLGYRLTDRPKDTLCATTKAAVANVIELTVTELDVAVALDPGLHTAVTEASPAPVNITEEIVSVGDEQSVCVKWLPSRATVPDKVTCEPLLQSAGTIPEITTSKRVFGKILVNGVPLISREIDQEDEETFRRNIDIRRGINEFIFYKVEKNLERKWIRRLGK
jgi:hypothetical protein